MLPRLNRLTKNKEFENVFKKGRSSYDKILGIKAAPNNLGTVRFGILISAKISKKAVERNKVRRRIREVLKKNLEKLDSCDMVIITLKGIIKNTYAEIEQSIVFQLKRLRLINDHPKISKL
jgi:ribonuclease P protein component